MVITAALALPAWAATIDVQKVIDGETYTGITEYSVKVD